MKNSRSLNFISLFCLFALVGYLGSCKSRVPPAVAKNITAENSFASEVELVSEVDIEDSGVSDLGAAYEQLEYLTGFLLHYGEFAKYPGTVEGRGRVEVLSSRASKGGSPTARTLRFSYKDIGYFFSALLPSNGGSSVQVFLPRNPKKFVADLVKSGAAARCAEGHWHGRQHLFWYYWKKDGQGCAIPDGALIPVTLSVKPIPRGDEKYPRYEEILGASPSRSRTVHVSLFWQDEDLIPGDEDLMKTVENHILAKVIRGTSFAQAPANPDLVSHLIWEKDGLRVVFRSSRVEPASKVFIDQMRQAMINDDVVIFAGHSNYGEVLSPERLGITSDILDQSKRQIFIFAGCRTHSYFSRRYLDLKPGSLTVMAMATPSYGFVYPSMVAEFLARLLDPERPSWRAIARSIAEREREALKARTYESGGRVYNYDMWPHFKSLIVIRE